MNRRHEPRSSARGPTGRPCRSCPDPSAGLKQIIGKITASGARVILCTPSVIGEKPDGGNSLDRLLDAYSDISRQVAKETKVPLCDLRKAFLDYLKEHNPDKKESGVLTSDRVHLNEVGNRFVAEVMLHGVASLSIRHGQHGAGQHAEGRTMRKTGAQNAHHRCRVPKIHARHGLDCWGRAPRVHATHLLGLGRVGQEKACRQGAYRREGASSNWKGHG
jgi:hypothetical protein